MSTLRFANRAKSIKTKAVVNESPTDRLIREMKGEIERLKGLKTLYASFNFFMVSDEILKRPKASIPF